MGAADVGAGAVGADAGGWADGAGDPSETTGGGDWLGRRGFGATRVTDTAAVCELRPGKALAARPANRKASTPAPAAAVVVSRCSRRSPASRSPIRRWSTPGVKLRRMKSQ